MRRRHGILALLAALGLTVLPACTDVNNMREQPRYGPLTMSPFFADSAASRPDVPGTVPRRVPGDRRALTPAESLLVIGAEPDSVFAAAADARPRSVTAALLARGQQRFDIFCAPCHGRDGYGQGLVVLRGFPQPPTFHSDRLRTMSDQEIFTVIAGGRGKMPPYGPYVPVADRWAIIAYLRALQLSQAAPAAVLSAADHAGLAAAAPEAKR